MSLKILLPSGQFLEQKDISQVIAEGSTGSFGILPHRMDCLAALVPGILTYESKAFGEKFIAIDEGVLIKTGLKVLISVRKAIKGKSLQELQLAVEDEFVHLNEQEIKTKQAIESLESHFIERFVEMKK